MKKAGVLGVLILVLVISSFGVYAYNSSAKCCSTELNCDGKGDPGSVYIPGQGYNGWVLVYKGTSCYVPIDKECPKYTSVSCPNKWAAFESSVCRDYGDFNPGWRYSYPYEAPCPNFSIRLYTNSEWLDEMGLDRDEYNKKILVKDENKEYYIITEKDPLICEVDYLSGLKSAKVVVNGIEKTAECEEKDGKKECKAYFPGGEWERGGKIKCELKKLNFDNEVVIDDKNPIFSDEVVVAKYIYVMVMMGDYDHTFLSIMQTQYNKYLELSEINKNFKLVGKPVYYFPFISYLTKDTSCVQCEKLDADKCKSCDNCMLKKGIFKNSCIRLFTTEDLVDWRVKYKGYNKLKDDKIITMISNPTLVYGQGSGQGVTSTDSFHIFLEGKASNEAALSHEMGHASGLSRLCDEYGYKQYSLQLSGNKGCLNPFPKCCESLCGEKGGVWVTSCDKFKFAKIDAVPAREGYVDGNIKILECCKKPDNQEDLKDEQGLRINFGCGQFKNLYPWAVTSPFYFYFYSCGGMPYESDKNSKDDVWPGNDPAKFGPLNSIMSNRVETIENQVYPVEARCPLRNCA